MDSTIWNAIEFRADDIVIATYGKSGTTWTQQIIAQLLFADADERVVSEMSPWVDLRVPPRDVKLPALAAQAHRRFLKTHLPVDALRYAPAAKYIYVARDGRDVVWSLYNHHANANALWYAALNDTPGRVGPPIAPPGDDIGAYFRHWLQHDGAPFWSFWENVASWWAIRHLPNLMLLHFEDLKRDLPGSMRKIAAFLDVPIDEARFATQLEHCSFGWMKLHAANAAPAGGLFWEGGGETFIHKGTNGRWRDVLTAEDCAAYEATALQKLGADCAAWLQHGSLARVL
ncbi:MAG TPA: sulfotransferase domain-containing protein [Acidocella sp.]|nr:sulfotransferase domain-containing protein [Acidocella sp.]